MSNFLRCGPSRIRTGELFIANEAFYQLNYGPFRVILGAYLLAKLATLALLAPHGYLKSQNEKCTEIRTNIDSTSYGY